VHFGLQKKKIIDIKKKNYMERRLFQTSIKYIGTINIIAQKSSKYFEN